MVLVELRTLQSSARLKVSVAVPNCNCVAVTRTPLTLKVQSTTLLPLSSWPSARRKPGQTFAATLRVESSEIGPIESRETLTSLPTYPGHELLGVGGGSPVAAPSCSPRRSLLPGGRHARQVAIARLTVSRSGQFMSRCRRTLPNGSRLSCGRNAHGGKAPQQYGRRGGEATQLFLTCERPAASSAC